MSTEVTLQCFATEGSIMKWKVNSSFIPNLPFIPTQHQVNINFKTHVDAYGGDATNNQAGGGIAAEIAAPIRIENEVNTSSNPKPRYIPIPPRTKGRFARTLNRRNRKSPVPPPGLPNNASSAPAQKSCRQNSAWTPLPPPYTLLSISILNLRRKVRVLQKNQDTNITKISDMKAKNKQLNIDCNDKYALSKPKKPILQKEYPPPLMKITTESKPCLTCIDPTLLWKIEQLVNRQKNCKSRENFEYREYIFWINLPPLIWWILLLCLIMSLSCQGNTE